MVKLQKLSAWKKVLKFGENSSECGLITKFNACFSGEITQPHQWEKKRYNCTKTAVNALKLHKLVITF